MSTYTQEIPTTDPRLGRHIEHDPASRGFAMPTAGAVDKATWRDRKIRVYDPIPNPDQVIGNCTMCSKATMLNAAGNRATGVILDMAWATQTYQWETANDEFPGAYPPDDTGSSGLASCKTAQHVGAGGEYRWIFGGADEVVQNIVEGRVISLGTYWYQDMFTLLRGNVIKPGGSIAGGHQWAARGYAVSTDRVMGRCWWDGFKDFWIARGDLDDLLHQWGDAHFQVRTG